MPSASKEVIICNSHGLHTRPVMQFVEVASQFASRINVSKAGPEPVEADGKSMMQMIILEAVQGTPLTISAEGADAVEAVNKLAALIQNKFGEE